VFVQARGRVRMRCCSCWLLQCMIVDDWSEDGRVLVLIEAIDRPRLLNDITRIITEESGSSAAAVFRFPPPQVVCLVLQILRSRPLKFRRSTAW